MFTPHSHDSVDSALEASEDGIRAVKISLDALLATSILQAVVVVLTGSVALLADTIHNFSDALTAVPLWITVAILFVLRGAATDSYRRLMDAVDPELVDLAEKSLRSVPGVLAVEELRLRWIGHRVRAETGIVVDPELSIVAAHDIATKPNTPCCTTSPNSWPPPCTSARATPTDTTITPRSPITPPRWNPERSPGNGVIRW